MVKSKDLPKHEQLTEECVSTFGKLNNSVNKALEQGRKGGFADREVGDMIRTKLLSAGYSRMTISRALPPLAKHVEYANKRNRQRQHNKANKMLAANTNITNNTNTLNFQATISGTTRKLICIPRSLASSCKRFENKKVSVIVSIIE